MEAPNLISWAIEIGSIEDIAQKSDENLSDGIEVK